MPHLSEDRDTTGGEGRLITETPLCPESRSPLSGGVMIVCIVIAAIAIAAQFFWPESEKKRSAVESSPRVTASVASGRRTADSPCAAPVEVELKPGVRVEIPLVRGCAWDIVGSRTNGSFRANNRACRSIFALGEDGREETGRHGACSEGTVESMFREGWHVSRLYLRSEEDKAVYLTILYSYE